MIAARVGFTFFHSLGKFAQALTFVFLRTEKTLHTALVCQDILRLCDAGADKVLMACCTASTVHKLLPSKYRKISIPIISPIARAAALATKSGRIGVIATERTLNSEAFRNELLKYNTVKEVFSLKTQKLVSIVEDVGTDENLPMRSKDSIRKMLYPMRDARIDTLILGCTHFPRLELTIGNSLPGVRLISSTKEGARELKNHINGYGKGQTIYL